MRKASAGEKSEQTTARGGKGQVLVEYGLVLLLVAVVVVAMVRLLGATTNNTYCKISSSVSSAVQ